MSDQNNRAQFASRRADLLAELFLQQMEPAYLARPDSDFGYDFFVGVPNQSGGVNTFVVEVKATEQEVGEMFGMPRDLHHRLAYSNVSALLLVVDVKHNKIYFGWPSPGDSDGKSATRLVRVPVQEAQSDTPELIKASIAKQVQDLATVSQ